MPRGIAQLGAGSLVAGDLVGVTGASAQTMRESPIQFQLPTLGSDTIEVFIDEQTIRGVKLLINQVFDFIIKTRRAHAQVLRQLLLIDEFVGINRLGFESEICFVVRSSVIEF